MKKCTYCGYDMEDDSNFCHKCGKKVKKKVKRNVAPLWLCFTVIGILFVGLFVLYLFRKQPDEMREDVILKSDDIPDNYLYMDEFTDKPIVDQETALEAVEDVAEMIGIKNVKDELTIHSECTAFDNTFYRFEQEYQGIPVYGRTVIIEADKNGQSLGLSSNYYDVTGVNTNVTYREEDVKEVLTSIYGEDAGWLNEGLVIYSLNREKPELSWRFLVNPDADMEYCFVSAQNGEMIAREPLVYYETVRGSGKDIDGKEQEFNTLKEGSTYYLRDEERNISVFNANGERLEECIVYEDYNGNVYYHDQKNKRFINKDGEEVKIVLDEPRNRNIVYDMQGNILSDGLQHVGLYLRTKGLNPFANIEEATNSSTIWKDKKAVTVISRVSDIHDFYKEVLSRNGFNNKNGEVKVVYNNNVFLDNDNASSKYGSVTPFTLIEFRTNNAVLSVDVIAHEYTHSVETSISNMTYEGESGALKEAYSDIFGEIIQDWCDNRKLDNSCDWIHGKRILSNPEKNKYPCFYKGKYWCNTTDVSKKNDWGGVHKNSTVISYAAYLMNCGIDDSNQYEKLGTDKLAELFYSALLSKLQKDCDFQQFRTIVYHTALKMQKQDRLTEKQVACVDKAFDMVGLYREDNEINPIEKESGEPEEVPNLPEETNPNSSLVTDAFYDCIMDEYLCNEVLCYHIPRINLNNDILEDANTKIYNQLYSILQNEVYVNRGEEYYYPSLSEMVYKWGQTGNIVSIIVKTNHTDCDWTQYYVYNVSIESGEEISDSELIRAYGLTEDEFYDLSRETVRKHIENISDLISSEESYSTYVELTLSEENIKETIPYINSNGELCIVANIYYPIGAESYWTLLNTVNINENENQGFECTINHEESITDIKKSPENPEINIEFKVQYDDEQLNESAIITGNTRDGNEVWKYTTKSYPIGQITTVEEIGLYNSMYYFCENGKVITLDPRTGEIIWENNELYGTGICYAFDEVGNIYLSGGLGPDLMVIDINGNTLRRIERLDGGKHYWPYRIEYRRGYMFITFEAYDDWHWEERDFWDENLNRDAQYGGYTLSYCLEDGAMGLEHNDIESEPHFHGLYERGNGTQNVDKLQIDYLGNNAYLINMSVGNEQVMSNIVGYLDSDEIRFSGNYTGKISKSDGGVLVVITNTTNTSIVKGMEYIFIETNENGIGSKYTSDNLMGKIERISATSYLSESNVKHIPEFATDGDIKTAWVEGVEGQGIGEKLTITFNDTSYVSGFVINAGYQKSEKLYKKNSRPKSLKVMFSDGEMEEFVLDDTLGEQEFYFKTPRNTTFVSFTISSVYPGEVYQDTVISEIILR